MWGESSLSPMVNNPRYGSNNIRNIPDKRIHKEFILI